MTARDAMTRWAAHVLGDPGLAARLDAVYRFEIAGADGGHWILSCRSPVGFSEAGADAPAADCTLEADSADIAAIGSRQLNPQIAFLEGRLAVRGDAGAALRLSELLCL